jgi:Metallo-peptidase family M12B Reprolysin-like/Secretion system C-terminal sorting domain
MKKGLLLTLVLILISTLGFSQSDKFWSVNNDNKADITTDKAVARVAYPKVFKLFDLNTTSLRKELFAVVGTNVTRHSTVITIPNANGKLEEFEVFEASNFEPDLQAQFPDIRAYSGRGITDKYASLKLSISPQGIQTMVFRAEKPAEFIEPYSKDHSVYAVYASQRDNSKIGWSCSTVEDKMVTGLNEQVSSLTGSSNGTLKTMRLAQSCNGEYANYFGATSSAQVALVLAAINATLTRCNGVYEKDLALHLNLIANTTSVFYYNPATDPYSTQLSQWNLQLQQTLTNVIGSANYDIGHMFGASGGGGNAGCIGCVCVNPANKRSLAKGAGITSPADGIPQGDNFDIDYVVHEVGHQLGANHTFSMSNEGTGVNKEVGSGITIMGYAGITSQDVAPHSIDIFHQASIGQIQANLATKTCPVTTNITANNVPPVIAALNNYTIPVSTPFALTGSATDANGDAVTYCWEQNDNASSGQTGASSVASPTKATGPNWLSFSPAISGTRTFPRLSTILAGLNVTGPLPGGDAGANIEALSSVSRTLNFRLTVRDNHAFSSTAPVAVGQTAFADAVVTVSNTSGPFAVTAPNTAVTWNAGSAVNVTWSVNGTTAAPVSCANVKISLSTDGGLTFPTVLAASTANDGSETITVPSATSTTCRVKVEAVGNIFFDISNANFTIAPAFTGNTPKSADNKLTASPNPASSVINLEFNADASNSSIVTVIDQSGVVALQRNITVVKGSNKKMLDISTLRSGIYTITINEGINLKTTKIIVNK